MLAARAGGPAPFQHGLLESLELVRDNHSDQLREIMSNPLLHRLLAIHKRLSDMASSPCQACNTSAYDLAGNIYETYRCHPVTTAASEELLLLLSKPFIRALFDAHDRIACKEFLPVLPEISEQVDEDEQAVKIVRIEKRKEPLGATLRVNESGLAYIARVLEGGPAERSGIIHSGDEVHEVNGQRVHGLTVEEVAQLMSLSDRSIVLKLVPAQLNYRTSSNQFSVRANFSYDPANDPSLPCREAGMSFKRGEVLHVVNACDINWWQAFKDGEDMEQCVPRAMLIPSSSLQERRLAKAQRHSMTSGSTSSAPSSPGHMTSYPKRATMPLLAGGLLSPRLYRKACKAKRTVHEAWSGEELYIEDRVVPYEEIKSYLPIPGRRRPLILIGPADTVRHELRLKLLTDKQFCSPVLHTSRSKKLFESEGKDYHFVSRAEMEAEIEQSRFVEFGEYKGNLYGTKLDSIINIIDSGRTCVMAPQPQAIGLLRRKEIKPYVVYVEPLTVDTVKHSKSSSSNGISKQDVVLVADMVLCGARIDAIYGHYFDYRLNVSSLHAAYRELMSVAKRLEVEPQWLPSNWIED